jgi:hypothetical protein
MTVLTPDPLGHARELLFPQRLWSRAEVLAHPCPVPRSGGVYAWYFRQLPPPSGATYRTSVNDQLTPLESLISVTPPVVVSVPS